MTGKAGFKYALEPVRLTRKWSLDALLADLGSLNASLSGSKSRLSKVVDEMAAASGEWKKLASAKNGFDAANLKAMNDYIRHLSDRHTVLKEEVAKLEEERNMLIDQVSRSKKELDAVEQHHERMQSSFLQTRLRVDLKSADHHWNALHARKEEGND